MKVNLLSCDAQRLDRRAIAKCIAEISSHIDGSLANELTGSPSKSISVSSFDKDSVMLDEISAIHVAIALLSGLRASQDNKFNFIIKVY